MPNKDPEKYLPTDSGTRGQWFLELLSAWEGALLVAERGRLQQVARNLKTAILILKSSYSCEEMLDLEYLYTLEEKLSIQKSKK